MLEGLGCGQRSCTSTATAVHLLYTLCTQQCQQTAYRYRVYQIYRHLQAGRWVVLHQAHSRRVVKVVVVSATQRDESLIEQRATACNNAHIKHDVCGPTMPSTSRGSVHHTTAYHCPCCFAVGRPLYVQLDAAAEASGITFGDEKPHNAGLRIVSLPHLSSRYEQRPARDPQSGQSSSTRGATVTDTLRASVEMQDNGDAAHEPERPSSEESQPWKTSRVQRPETGKGQAAQEPRLPRKDLWLLVIVDSCPF